MKKNVIAMLMIVALVVPICFSPAYADSVIDMNPKVTNEAYEKMIIGERSELKDEKDIEDFDYHDSVLWAAKGWTRGLLIAGLMSDLQKNNQSLFNKYYYSEKTNYVMINGKNTGNGYTYTVFVIVGNNAILFFYNPEEGYANYSEKIGLTKNDLQMFALLSEGYWKVTSDDMLSISELWS